MARKLHQYSVPMTITLKGYVTVEAASEEGAEEKAESGHWVEFNRNAAEMTDWEVDGEPEMDG